MLHSDQQSILEGLSSADPSLRPIISGIGVRSLTYEEREKLREALLDELLETGLQDDDEPSNRGHLIEGLIDLVGRI